MRAGVPKRGRGVAASANNAILIGRCDCSSTRVSTRRPAGESGPAVSGELCSSASRTVQSRHEPYTADAGSLKPRRLFLCTKNTKNQIEVHEEGRRTTVMTQIEVGILGATGMVGQQFIALLANHP